MNRKKIKALGSPIMARAAIIGEFRMLTGRPLDPETTSAVSTIRKDRPFSDKVALGMRYLDAEFVKHSIVHFEKLSLEQLMDWLERRSTWVRHLERLKDRPELSPGLPGHIVAEFGFHDKYRGQFELKIEVDPGEAIRKATHIDVDVETSPSVKKFFDSWMKNLGLPKEPAR